MLSTRNRVTFHDLDNRGRPNILKSLRLLFQSVIKNITEFMEPSDLVCMLVQCPEFDFPISLPFMTLSQLSAERFLIWNRKYYLVVQTICSGWNIRNWVFHLVGLDNDANTQTQRKRYMKRDVLSNFDIRTAYSVPEP